MRRLLIVMALIAASLSIAAPVHGQEGTGAASDRLTVAALDNVFAPPIARVAVGGTVEWKNEGGSRHTVDADDGSWASGKLEPGADFARTFDDAGVFPFFCRYH